MLAVKRADSVAAEQHAVSVRRQRVLDGLQAVPGEGVLPETVPGFGPAELWHYFACFEVLANMWGIAGCFKVRQGPLDEEVLYCNWQDAYDYVTEFKEKAEEVLGCFPEEAVLRYVSDTEERIRAVAIDLSRGPLQLPWGQALKRAAREQSHRWAEAHDSLLTGPSLGHEPQPC